MAILHGDVAEQAWRESYDQMHEAALSYAQSMRASLQALYVYRGASEPLANFGFGMRRAEAAPVVLGSEILENWLRDVETNHDFELSRRARQSS
jgi:hypothetical protein